MNGNLEKKSYKLRTIEWKFKEAQKEYPTIHIDGRVKITSPDMVYNSYKDFFSSLANEHFAVVWLNSSNKIMGFEIISIGTLNSSLVHPREVFRGAIVAGAASIILLHNHPSGNTSPSNEDISITQKLVETGKILDIPVFDHLIITYEGYTSFMEKRLIIKV